MDLASLYPSSADGAGVTLSPLSAPAAAPPEAVQPNGGPAASPTVAQPASDDPGELLTASDLEDLDGDADDDLDERIDRAIEQHKAEQDSPGEPVDLTVDERADFFKDVRSSEPAPASSTDYAAVTRLPGPIEATGEVGEGIATALDAAAKAGIGVTAMQGFWNSFVDAAKTPIRTTPQAAQAALTAQWGDKTEAKLAAANGYIDTVAQRWPGVRDMLRQTGLGNDPAFIKQIVARAQQRGR